MNVDLRSQALAKWQKLLLIPANSVNDEDRYDELLRTADDMERAGLITSDEWRKLVQRAGTLLASTAECMVALADKVGQRSRR